MIDWSTVFDEATPVAGASEAEIARFVSAICAPLSSEEVAAINQCQRNPFPEGDPLHAAHRPFDPTAWVMPARTLPKAYLDLLRWSNGGWTRSGEREFGWFPTDSPAEGVRAMMLAYHMPEYMPGALPFAFDGGGTFYLFDMRNDAVGGEYPIVAADAGNLGWAPDACFQVADCFEAACRGRTELDDVRHGTKKSRRKSPPDRVDVFVIRVPKGGVRQLRAACNHLGLALAMSELPAILKKLPYRLCHDVPYLPTARLVAELADDDPCLGVFAVDRPKQPVSLPPWEWR